MNEKGSVIIEIILTLTMIAIITVSLSKAINDLNKTNAIIEARTQAQAFAQTELEIVTLKRNDYFTSNSGCWTEYPKNFSAGTEFSIDEANDFNLINYNPTATKINEWTFTKKIIITNAKRDADQNLVFDNTGTSDYNSKIIQSQVEYSNTDGKHTISVSSLLTSWDNVACI